MALIHFELKHPDNIIPWGDAPDTSMDWYGLTDGAYWLDVNKAKLYEYAPAVLAGGDDAPYVEFPIARLAEDLTGMFDPIAEPVPDAFYAIVRTHDYLYRFYGAVQHQLDKLSQDPALHADYQRYDKAIEWIYNRTLPATHLTAAPGISFFRNGERISIVWQADHLAAHNTPVWTAQNGEVEIEYATFCKEMADFGERFFTAMDKQIQIATDKDWGTTRINKERLIAEQQERKIDFQKKLAILNNEPAITTDWALINSLVTEMFS